METLFLGCFAVGLLFTIVSVAMGASHGALDAGHGHMDTGPLALHDAGHGQWLGQLNLSGLMAGLMWFGGAGWVVLSYAPFGVLGAVAAGVPSGLMAYKAVAWFVNKLRASETVMKPEDYEMTGTVARVTVPASPGGVGEIVFTLAGVQRVEGARAAEGKALTKGEEVVITGYERGLAIVEDAETFINGEPGALPAPAERQEHPQATPARELDS